jgi:hypothetical protein
MIATTIASLFILLRGYIAQRNVILAVTDVLMMVLAAGVIGLAIKTYLRQQPAVEAATRES